MSEQLFQVAIKAIVRNAEGEILLLHIPEWSGNLAHWDMPGGRMDPGEGMLATLHRELLEEIGVDYGGEARQLMAFLTSITIPVGEVRYPLVFVAYQVDITDTDAVQLSADTREDDLKWFSPAEAAKELAMKCAPEFCQLVAAL